MFCFVLYFGVFFAPAYPYLGYICQPQYWAHNSLWAKRLSLLPLYFLNVKKKIFFWMKGLQVARLKLYILSLSSINVCWDYLILKCNLMVLCTSPVWSCLDSIAMEYSMQSFDSSAMIWKKSCLFSTNNAISYLGNSVQDTASCYLPILCIMYICHNFSCLLLYSFEYVGKFFCVLLFKQNIDRTGCLLSRKDSFNVCKKHLQRNSVQLDLYSNGILVSW